MNSYYYEVDGNFIKKLRLDAGLSYYDFANIYSVTPQTIQNWENNKSKPNTLHIANMLQLRKRVDELIKSNKNDISDVLKAIFIGGGMLAFLIWLFNKD